MREIKSFEQKPQPTVQRDGKIVAVIGTQGSGKTLTLTHLALMRRLQGDTIYCNYHLYANFPYYYLDKKEDIFKNLNDIKNSSIIIDEFHAYLDAYDWYKDEVINFVKTNMITARRNGNWCLTGNQLANQYPLRLRKIIPLWLTPKITSRAYRKGKIIPKVVTVEEVNKNLGTFTTWRFRADLILDLFDTYEDFTHILSDNGGAKHEIKRKIKKNKG